MMNHQGLGLFCFALFLDLSLIFFSLSHSAFTPIFLPSLLISLTSCFLPAAADCGSLPLPGRWREKLDSFQVILVLKALRPDKVTNAMQHYVASKLGQKFIEPQTTDLGVVFKDSSVMSPLVFVLSTGTDPAGSLYQFANSMKFTDRLFAISLGQGQVIPLNLIEFLSVIGAGGGRREKGKIGRWMG